MCQIDIESMAGLQVAAGSPPARIVVQGTADCRGLIISFDRPMTQDGRSSFGPVPVVEGLWSLVLTPPHPSISCGDTVKVEAQCADDRSCRHEASLGLMCTVARPDCPVVTLEVIDVARECVDGRRLVTFRVTVEGAPPSTVVQVDFDDGDSRSGAHVVNTGSEQWTERHAYVPGTYRAHVDVILPAGCLSDDPAERPGVAFGPLAACAVVCPILSLREPRIGDCDASGRRQVVFTVDYRGAQAGTQLQLSYGDGTYSEVQTVSGDGSRAFAAHPYPTPGPFTAILLVLSPEGCIGQSRNVSELRACGGSPDPTGNPSQPPPEEQPTANRPEIPWCLLVGLLALVLTGVGLAMMAFFFCVLCYADWIIAALLALGVISGGSTSAVSLAIVIVLIVLIFIGVAITIAGNVLFLIWLLTCATCRTNCRLLWNIHTLLVWVIIPLWAIITAIAAIVGIASGGRPCAIGWLIGLLDFAMLDAILLYYGAAVGCFQWPDWVPRFLRLRIPDPLRFICGRGG
jgi:hypothetical protein